MYIFNKLMSYLILNFKAPKNKEKITNDDNIHQDTISVDQTEKILDVKLLNAKFR